jgi:hypothetical protein
MEEPIKVFFTLGEKQLLVDIGKCLSNYKLLFLSLLTNPAKTHQQNYLDANAIAIGGISNTEGKCRNAKKWNARKGNAGIPRKECREKNLSSLCFFSRRGGS